MGDPAGQEQKGVGLRQIERIEPGDVKEVPCMIKRHDDHRNTAKDVD